jgi:hypothetical protein
VATDIRIISAVAWRSAVISGRPEAKEDGPTTAPVAKPLGIFTVLGLELYCRFSKETTTVPYAIADLEEAIAFVERRRQGRRSGGELGQRAVVDGKEGRQPMLFPCF